MLGVQVSLCAVRAGEFAICILLGNLGLGGGRSGCWRGRPARRAGQNATATLRAHDMGRLVVLLHQRRLGHHRALRVGRSQPALGHHATSRHRAQHGRDATTRGRGRCDRLRVSRRDRGLGHHGRRCLVRLLLLPVRVVHQGVLLTRRSLLRWRGRIAAHGVGRVGSRRSARRVRVARVHGHGGVVVEGWQSLVLAVLEVVGGRDCRGRRIRSRARVIDHVRRVVVVVVHNPTRCLPRCDDRNCSIRTRLWLSV